MSEPDIIFDKDRLITPNGEIPLNAMSDAYVVYIPLHRYAKRAAGAALILGGIFTQGGMWLMAPGFGVFLHGLYRLSLKQTSENTSSVISRV